MAREYTPSQKQAIASTGHNILVSASAGSGKTSVLVERVIQKIIKGEDVDQLLVVTFTEAAASEMKERIRQAIIDKINEGQSHEVQTNFSDQLNKLNNASISTLHSFCMEIIKNYYYVIDLDPSFRLMDTPESELLKENVWSDLREELYEADVDGSFARLTRNFSSDRSDEGLLELMLKVFDFSNANPDPDAWLDDLAHDYELDSNDIMDSKFIQNVLSEIKTKLIRIYQKALNFAEMAANVESKTQTLANNFRLEADSLKTAIDSFDSNNWDNIVNSLNQVKFARMPGGKASEALKDFKEHVKEPHDQIKSDFNDIVEKYFLLDSATLAAATKDGFNLILKLVEVQKQFAKRFLETKLEKRSLDFSDLEHFALNILTSDTTEGRAVRESYQRKFNEVIVDEYQDINPLQETILTSVSRNEPGNMFMVGDVKQSIYAFRMADPGLFIKKNDQFKDANNPNERIILAENFRSMQNVDDFTNFLFNQIMDAEVGDVEYDDDAQLKFGAKYYPEAIKNNTELLLYEDENLNEEDEDDNTSLIEDKRDGQLHMIAQKIKFMMDNETKIFDGKADNQSRKLKYSDIALLHSAKGSNLAIVDMFKKYGIPIEVNDAEDYFQTTEVSIVMALLKIIDNPYQDIPLAAVLRSPIVGLGENELAFLRIGKRNGQYYEALQYFNEEFELDESNEFQLKLKHKVAHFLEQLDYFRKLAQQSSIVELLWEIYDKTGFLDYVGGMPDGPQRQNNLHALYERARGYEDSSFKGLFQFVRFVEKLREKDKDLAENPVVNDSDSVKLMTIHGSKGLEFPVVFLIEAEHGFNTMDTKGLYILDRDAGMGITVRDFNRHLEIDLPQKGQIIQLNKQKMLAEKLRVLYVALTRAQQKLIITGAVNSVAKAIEKWSAAAEPGNMLIPSDVRLKVKNFLDFIGMSVVRIPEVANDLKIEDPVLISDNCPTVKVEVKNEADLQQNYPSEVRDEKQFNIKDSMEFNLDLTTSQAEFEQILNFKYKDEAATKTTAYQSVSEIKRVFDDPDKFELTLSAVDSQQHLKTQNRYVSDSLKQPSFLQSTSEIKPTDIGTATHLILQQLDLTSKIDEDVVLNEIARLKLQGSLTSEVADKIKVDTIVEFFNSDLGQIMLNHSQNVKREEPFSLLLPAKGLFEGIQNDQDVLIHGIIDAYLELDDRVILLDYKTDYVLPGSAEQGVEKVISKYRGQINLYAKALENILGKNVNEKYIYLLSIGKLIEIN